MNVSPGNNLGTITGVPELFGNVKITRKEDRHNERVHMPHY